MKILPLFFDFFEKFFFGEKKNRRRPADRHFIPGIQLFHFSLQRHMMLIYGQRAICKQKNAAYPQNKGFH